MTTTRTKPVSQLLRLTWLSQGVGYRLPVCLPACLHIYRPGCMSVQACVPVCRPGILVSDDGRYLRDPAHCRVFPSTLRSFLERLRLEHFLIISIMFVVVPQKSVDVTKHRRAAPRRSSLGHPMKSKDPMRSPSISQSVSESLARSLARSTSRAANFIDVSSGHTHFQFGSHRTTVIGAVLAPFILSLFPSFIFQPRGHYFRLSLCALPLRRSVLKRHIDLSSFLSPVLRSSKLAI